MHAELNGLNVAAEQWTRGKPLAACRWVASLTPAQTAGLLALRDGEGALVSLKDRAVYCYKGNTLPPLPRWLTLAPPVPMTPWRFARCLMLFGVFLAIIAVHGVRDMLVRMVRLSRA